MGTSEAARARYRSEGAAEFRAMLQDLRDRGWTQVAIARACDLSENTISNISIILRRFGDHGFLVEPETYEKVEALHARILAGDPPDIEERILHQKIRVAHTAAIKQRRRVHGSL